MFTCLTLLLAVCAVVRSTNVPLGYGVRVDPNEGASDCVLNVDIPVGDANEDCEIEVHVNARPFRDYTLLWKSRVQGFAFDASKDVLKKRAGEEDRYLGSCKFAGAYSLALRVDDSAINTNVVSSLDTITIIRRENDDYFVRPVRNMRTAEVRIAEGHWFVMQISLDETATPHLDIDLGATSKLDNLDYYINVNGSDVRSGEREELSADATLDLFARDLPAGDYEIGVHVKDTIGGSFATFSVGYDLNSDASGSIDYAHAECPEAACESAELQSCEACTDESCHWCDATRTCTHLPGQCADDYTPAGECEDLAARCLAHGECASCADDERCVWCERTIGANVCSAGKDDLGAECPGIFDGDAIAERAQCPAVIADDLAQREAECAKIATCSECAANPGCVYCDRAVGNDACSAGVDGDAKECDGLLFDSEGINDAAQCPDVLECAALPKCAQCVDGGCAWCDDSCVPASAQCDAERADELDACPNTADCKQYGNCAACTLQEGCIYCIGLTGEGACEKGKDDKALQCSSLTDRKRVHCSECAEDVDNFCPSAASPTLLAASVALLATLIALVI